MFLLILGHVDGGEELAAAVEQFGQLHHGFGFTHTAGAGQQEGAHWATRATQVGAGGEQVLVQCTNGGVLAFDVRLQILRQAGDLFQLVGGHAVDRNTGPVGDDFSHLAGIDTGVYQWLVGLQLFQFLFDGGGFAFQVRTLFAGFGRGVFR